MEPGKSRFNAESTAADVLRDVNLSGKLALVTGGGGGLGLETARALAAAGANVIIGGRSGPAIEAARIELARDFPRSQFFGYALHLADLGSVETFARAVLGLGQSIDIYIANAGIMAVPLSRNAAGHELHLATNFLGHALLTSLLAPALKQAGSSRVVVLSSSGHHFASVDLDDLDWRTRAYDKWLAYGQSKTACSLLAVHTAVTMRGAGVTALAVHPGVIATGLMRHLQEEDYAALKTRTDIIPPKVRNRKTLAQGAATSVWAATAPELAGRIAYLEDCAVARVVDTPDTVSGVLAYALDPTLADRLMATTERLIGRDLAF